jgi:pumilio RNA-binding family
VAALAQQLEIVAELAPSALRCVCDQNANHVVQKVIEQVPAERAELILAELSGHALSLSSHSYGCRVLQRALEYGSDAQRACILAELLPASASVLCADQYGNYVMQSVVQLCEPHARACVAAAVLERAREYATHKFASNVVEKVLQFGTEAQRDALVARLLGAPADGGALADVGVAFDAIDLLVRDAFGNYVLQRAVDVCSPAHRSLIALYAQSNLAALSTMTYGKHLLAKLDRLDRLETPRGRAAQFGGGGGGGHGGGHGEGSRGRREREGSARSSR